jgi:hypothetical protein
LIWSTCEPNISRDDRRNGPPVRHSSAGQIAELYADSGDKDRAFHWLDTGYRERDYWMITLNSDFVFDPLRSDPRFAELVRKVGLPQ